MASEAASSTASFFISSISWAWYSRACHTHASHARIRMSQRPGIVAV